MKTFLLLILTFFLSSNTYAQTINLSTYYPSPFGAYDFMLLEPRAVITDDPCTIGTLFVEDGTDTADDLGRIWYCDENHVDIPAEGQFRLGINAWTLSNDRNSLFPRDYDNTSLRVGIGTSEPDSIFHITAATDPRLHIQSRTDVEIELEADGAGSDTNSPYILFSQDAADVRTLIGVVGGAGLDPTYNTYLNTLADSLLIGTQSASPVQFGANGAVSLTVAANGNVGIGTRSPSTHLEILSAGTTTLNLSSSSASRILMKNTGIGCTQITTLDGNVNYTALLCPL